MPNIDLNQLVRMLGPELRVALETAASIAARNANPTVEVAHWLSGLVQAPGPVARFEQAGIGVEALRRELDLAIADLSRDSQAQLTLSQNVLTLAREAWLVASLQFGRNRVEFGDLLVALATEQNLRIVARATAPSLRDIDLKAVEAALADLKAADVDQAPAGTPPTAGATGESDFLRLYTQDMTADARSGRIDPVIGRDRELRQVVDVLMRRRQNNPILVGEAGVGKTAIAEALALEIAAGNVPAMLKDVRLLSLDLSLLQAGAGVKGEFERRLHGVVDAVKASSVPIILFIDEAHSLIGAGGQAGQGDAANILKPSLARGELRTIAATTWGEYKRFIERDAALTRRFQTVKVDEPDEETAIRMLRGVAGAFRSHHKVRIRDEALAAAVRLSARYIPARQLPDKAISLIDTAAAAVSLGRQAVPEAIRTLRSERELLEVETAWLAKEPESAEGLERQGWITTRLVAIADEIEALEARFEAEARLVEEADRLEAILSGEDEAGEPSSSGGEEGNVAPFPEQPGTRESARAALAEAEGSLAALTGETPLLPRAVDREVIAALVARWTGIPVGKLLTDQVETVKTLEARLKERVIGQDGAVGRVASAMRTARAGLNDPRRPPAVFLFVGMSGTGKTETALALADLLYGGSQYLTTINMSEFKEEHKISMLLGSPPGYVGYGEGGVLTEAIRRRPYGVLLLDEIDKAHPGVQEIFYQVFDKGTLRDGEGRDIDFKNTTIVMTANTGSELLATLAADPDTMPEGEALEGLLLGELQKQFKPAFLGRTTILPFMPLGREALSGIVDIQIGRIQDRVAASYGSEVVLLAPAREALVARAGTSEMGARAIEAMIARELLPDLSTFFLDQVTAGTKAGRIEIGFDGHRFSIAAEPAAAKEFARPRKRPADKAASNGKKAHSDAVRPRKARAP
ncbi:type VI secretion system ATPase TssH [Labrys sp. ZIDIC5]|uniref:type VI secretion system ATPase TssH n=1 Tax=Labrys sedimenti TaxID=3106036 RepID=UPI002ACA894F|nr:type VI secretion system ATPase TssH [Labrys sp. ZIDIC5]MDZ5449883.1 type VI secretion system ATPase TssH [Labrys sp. ZIDIC5]